MTNALLAAPILVPLAAGALSIVVRRLVVQRIVSFVALGVSIAAAVTTLVRAVTPGDIQVSRLGGWPAPIAITLVADRMAAILVAVALVVLAIVLVFAIGQRASDEHSWFYHPTYMIIVAAISQSFLAGDLFNLFVAFEIMLMASYVLLTLEGKDEQIKSGTTYVVLNVLESLVLLMAIGLIFAATGTVSMAELPERLAALPGPVATGLQLLLLVAFGMKAAVFPLFFWLPDAYPTAPSSVTAVFAGLLTKVGVYCIMRTQTLLFPEALGDLVLWVGAATMLIGVLGAISHYDMKRLLSFHIVSQIGYMVFGIGVGGAAALAATLLYLVHQIPVKTALFLVEGIMERDSGSSSFDNVGGFARRSPLFAVLFMLPALSLAGIPPFSGFVAKFLLVRSGVDAGHYVVVGVALLVSALTLTSMVKIWVNAFWGEVEPASRAAVTGVLRHHPTMAAATVALVAVTLVIAVFSGPLYDFSLDAAREMTNPATYVSAVRGAP